MKKATFIPVTSSCGVCGNAFLKNRPATKRCPECLKNDRRIRSQKTRICKKHDVILERHTSCKKCSIENSLVKYTEENAYEWIECPLCGFRGGDLNTHIVKHHEMSATEFKKITGLTTTKSQKLRDNISGDKNPGYQHGGKYSPFSDKFIYAESTDAEALKKTAAQTRKNNDGNATTIEYWLKKTNGNLEEAKRLLSERQSTFSLEKCIEKHGEEAGLERWLERQEKWQNTLTSKPEDEINEINKKKSTKINYENLWHSTIDSPGIFYILELDNNIIKIGVTTQDINKRYNLKTRNKIKQIQTFNSTINHCFHIEQLIKIKYNNHVIDKKNAIDGFGWTETFNNISFDTILNEIENFSDPIKTERDFSTHFNITNA